MLGRSAIRISPRRAVLLLWDVMVIGGGMALAAVVRLGWVDGLDYLARHRFTILASAAVFLMAFYAGGLYEREALYHRGRRAWLGLPAMVVGLALVLTIVLFYARAGAAIGRGILMLAGGFVLLGAWGGRALYRSGFGYGLVARNALIIGEGNEAEQVLSLLQSAPDSDYRVFGVVTLQRTRAGEFVRGIPILGPLSRLNEFVDAYEVEVLIIATSLPREHTLLRQLRPLRYAGVEIIDFVGLYEELAHEIPIDHIDDEWLMYAAMNSSVLHIRKVKRGLDLMVAVVGLLVTLPVSLLAALAIKLTSRGPILYRQCRAGLRGRPYTLLKFRTMYDDAEAHTGPVWAARRDPRVTPVGRFLRLSRIDEIPQLINVLRGEMSLVGPRPERPEFVEMLAKVIPHYKERLLVPPGITGWAQVNYPYAASIEASRRKLQFDLYYIKHMSFMLDVLILLRTFRTIIAGLRHSEEVEIPEPLPKISDEPARTAAHVAR